MPLGAVCHWRLRLRPAPRPAPRAVRHIVGGSSAAAAPRWRRQRREMAWAACRPLRRSRHLWVSGLWPGRQRQQWQRRQQHVRTALIRQTPAANLQGMTARQRRQADMAPHPTDTAAWTARTRKSRTSTAISFPCRSSGTASSITTPQVSAMQGLRAHAMPPAAHLISSCN